MKEVKYIVTFAGVAFLLLGVLFGMVIMSFMFGNLNLATTASLSSDTSTLTNVSGGFINESVFTISEASDEDFLSFEVTEAFNVTNPSFPVLILPANYTVDADAGTITNATTTTYPDVNFTYILTTKSFTRLATEDTNNNSINAIADYSEQADTQLTVTGIAITLLVLIVLFLIFWAAFIKPMMEKKKGSMGGSFT